jgi:DNA-binding XRE family transcriptional regulator
VLVDFPDCPGCVTFYDPDEDESLEAVAREALEGWLEVHLTGGEAPPPPRAKVGPRSLAVRIAPSLSIALQIRWRRQELRLSQAQLGKLLGVSRQQAASLENPDSNLRLTTLEAAARALSVELEVGFQPMARSRIRRSLATNSAR